MAIDFRWQVQQAKQRFSEVLRAAESDGPQFVTRHGKDVAVVLSVEQFQDMQKDEPRYRNLADWIVNGPTIQLSDDEIDRLFARERATEPPSDLFVGPEWE